MNPSTLPAKGRIERLTRAVLERLQEIAWCVAPPLLRLALALPFLRSGRTRWDSFLSLSPATLYLFENQFKVHLFGAAFGFPAPDTIALVVAIAEITLPILLILGFATRLAALALLVMTGIIQLVFPDGWANFHLYWASLAVGIMAIGPGALSLDRLIDRESYRRGRVDESL
ncbi:DoxX family protein [Paraburkholderia pallida]|uniref:DoxX family protein n=1 Tax=Paraburkholderia pallida TaxID=2547399 RepID=A0A4P7CZ85_9BURK|nr:DoxX family protein [Paraburkholderia pallida]QBR01636.1 DoxX family protein [Paraburkholderia pallida]